MVAPFVAPKKPAYQMPAFVENEDTVKFLMVCPLPSNMPRKPDPLSSLKPDGLPMGVHSAPPRSMSAIRT